MIEGKYSASEQQLHKETKLLKNTGIIAIGNIGTKCVSCLLLPLYTSKLTTEQYGTVDLISTYVTLLAIILTLQFEQGLFRFLIEFRESYSEQKKYITTALVSVIIINFLAAVSLFVILFSLKYAYTVYLIAWAVLNSFNAMFLQIPRGMGDNVTYAFGGFLSGASQVLLNVVFIVYLKMGVDGMLAANILACGISVGFIIIKTKLWRYFSPENFDRDSFHLLLRYSLPLVPYTLCWWVISASDRQIIAVFLGNDANGIYSIAYKFASMFTLVTGIFQTAWAESAAENYETGNNHEYYNSMMDKAMKFYSSGNLAIIAAIPLVFNVFIKKDFVRAYNYVPILMMGSLLHAVSALYGSVYFAYKKTKEVSWTAYISALLNIVINFLLIKKIGLYAAALSTLIAYIAAIVIRHFDIQKYVSIKISFRYLLIELIAYMVVLVGYYSKNLILELSVLFLLIPYCLYQNREIVFSVIAKLKRKRLEEH